MTGDPLLAAEGGTACLLGNEAIVRGALESGVGFASGYPGTPSSEVTDSFARVARERGVVFEYSVNEKVALELAFAASLAGARSICAMKHLGLMAAGDPISTIPYVGVGAGMVVVSAGDPGCHTSPNEQDQRHLGPMLHLPVLDPATPAEAHGLTRFAFRLSEESGLPVLLRPTTRVAHTAGPVHLGRLEAPRVALFRRDPPRYTPTPANARRMRSEVERRMGRARRSIEGEGLFRATGGGPVALLASGAPAALCADLLAEDEWPEGLALWRLSAVHPLPEEALLERLGRLERLLVVEELSPFLEDALTALAARHALGVRVLGKRSGHLPVAFEYRPETVLAAVRGVLGEGGRAGTPVVEPAPEAPPPRVPSLCPGCPHRAAYVAARTAFDEDQLYFNDIGCYTLGYGPPLDTVDALLCMGAGLTLAAGVSRVTGRRTVGFLGDATFFHSGMPALLDATKEGVGMVAVILDNGVTAMTGFQPSPGELPDGGGRVSIEGVARALGAAQVEVVDPYDLGATRAAFGRARDARGLAVVVCRRACPVHEVRRGAGAGARAYRVEPAACRACGREAAGLRCSQPATEAYDRHLVRARSRQAPVAGDLAEPAPVAPCATRCPLGLCVQGYVGQVAAGQYGLALGHVLDRTPLPETVCRVCHRPCEEACVRRGSDEPVAINELKRFVVEWARVRGEGGAAPVGPDSGFRVAVVGAGPSGLAASLELRRRGHAVHVHDAAASPGGMLARSLPIWRLPPEALARDLERFRSSGVRFSGGMALGRDLALEGLLDGFDRVYLAVGAWRPRRLALEGADREGAPRVLAALDLLEAVRRGDRPAVGPRVAVVGGGNAAVDAARTALRLGAEAVTLVCLETRVSMPALRDEVDSALEEGVRLRPLSRPLALEEGGLRVAPVGASRGGEETVAADTVVVAIGQDPDLGCLAGLAETLALDAAGCIAVDPLTGRTSHPRIYAGGDAAGSERTVTGAMAAGQRAAWAMDRDLRGAALADLRAPPPLVSGRGAPPSPAGPRPLDREGRRRPARRAVEGRPGDFREEAGLTEAEVRREAARCLACGRCGLCRACTRVLGCPALVEDALADRVRVEPGLCLGCGVCSQLCPDRALAPVAAP